MLFVSMDFPPERRFLQLALRYLAVRLCLREGHFYFFFFSHNFLFPVFFFLEDNINWICLKDCVASVTAVQCVCW